MTTTEENEYGLGYAREEPKSSSVTLSPIKSTNSKSVDLENLNPELKERIKLAEEAWLVNKEFNPKGESLPITSGRRTRDQQYQEYKARLAGSKNTGFMAINPDEPQYKDKQFFHEDAVDMLTHVPNKFLEQFGLHRPFGSKDPVHVQINPKSEWKNTSNIVSNVKDETNEYGLGYARPIITSENKEAFPVTNPTSFAEDFRGQFKDLKKDLTNPDYYKNTLPKQAAALYDTLYGTVPGAIQFVGTPFAKLADLGLQGVNKLTEKPVINPNAATNVLSTITNEMQQPLGKAFGITQDPAYMGEASQRLMKYVGENMDKGADYISKETGLPKADVEWFMNAALVAAGPAAARAGKKVYETGKETLQNQFDSLRSKNNLTGRSSEPPGANLKGSIDELHQLYEEQRQAALQGNTPNGTVTLGPVTLENAGSAKPTTPDAPFVEVKYAENGLPLDEQYARAQTLNKVLGSDHTADLAAIEGKGKERATNYATSNTDTPIGAFLKEKFTEEQKRLADFAERQIKNTGGTVGLDESTVYKRGNTILKPLQGLETHFDEAISKIYKERDKLAKDIPVEAKNILEVLNDESLTLANTETIGLTNIAKARMKQLKMIDKDGNLLPIDAKTAESFRKFLNENWDRKNANLHRQLKEAVDTDVLANIDQTTPFYKEARDLVSLRKDTLDNPNGISKILDAEGPNKINRKVDIEKIAQNIADMPVDQITHVIETLKNVPESLQPQAGAALSEIKAQFANNLAAKKTPKQVTDFMNANSEVMNRLFTPEEMNNFRDYHNAVHILATDTGYKGAAVQKINVEQKLGSKIKEHLITKGGAVAAETITGGAGMGLPALLTHEYLSGRAAKKHSLAEIEAQAQALKETQERFVDIKDLIK